VRKEFKEFKVSPVPPEFKAQSELLVTKEFKAYRVLVGQMVPPVRPDPMVQPVQLVYKALLVFKALLVHREQPDRQVQREVQVQQETQVQLLSWVMEVHSLARQQIT
jgi:capsular polysaccharide biosynthesis protein